MLKTNREELVMLSVMGSLIPRMRPRDMLRWRSSRYSRYRSKRNNVKVGDPAFGWAGDHVNQE